MGMAPDGGTIGERPAGWCAPGEAHVGYGEYNQRGWLQLWAQHLGGVS
jgi:hypothetical protein